MKDILQGIFEAGERRIIRTAFELEREEYFLVKDGDIYTINYRIDRSYKGKCPDVGLPIVMLEDDMIEKVKKYLDMVIL